MLHRCIQKNKRHVATTKTMPKIAYSFANNCIKTSCYSNKIVSVSLRKCPYDHWLANKAYLSSIAVTNIYQSFTYKMAAKIGWHRYWTKLRHCRPVYSRICTTMVCQSVVRLFPLHLLNQLTFDLECFRVYGSRPWLSGNWKSTS